MTSIEKSRWQPWIELGLALLMGLIASVVLPPLLGEDLVVRQVARVYAPLAAHLHGEGRRDEISVLLIDDKTLADAGEAWPASYRYQSRLLDAVALYKPRAVFFDIVFSNARPDTSLPSLIEALCRVQAGGTKVYLAAQRQADGRFMLRPELEAAAGRCYEKVAIEYQPDAVDQTAWTYQLNDGLRLKDAPRSAALAMYENDRGPLPASADRSDLALTWGLVPAEHGVAWSAAPKTHDDRKEEKREEKEDKGGSATQEGYCRPSMSAVAETLPGFIRNRLISDAEKKVCVFNTTLYPADLVTSTDAEEAFVKTRLEGRFVMIGTALQGSNDRVQSPIHGRIPGVYLHAAALGNLLDDGADYKQATELGFPGDGPHVKVWLVLLIGLFPVLAVGALRRSAWGKSIVEWIRKGKAHPPSDEARSGKLSRKARETLGWIGWKSMVFASSFLLVSVLLFIGQSLLDVGFMTVIDVAVFSLAAEWFEWNSKLFAWWQDKPETAEH